MFASENFGDTLNMYFIHVRITVAFRSDVLGGGRVSFKITNQFFQIYQLISENFIITLRAKFSLILAIKQVL